MTLLKENGFEAPEPVAKKSKSRTSSEMLFEEKCSSNKKKYGKAGYNERQDKLEKEAGMSNSSKISNKSFGNALKGIPGTIFVVEGV